MEKNVRQTSIDTYRDLRVSGHLSERRYAVIMALYIVGPSTSGEIGHQMYGEKSTGSAYRNVHARMNELFKMGLVIEAGKRPCTITGRICETWQLTYKFPKGKIAQEIQKRRKVYVLTTRATFNQKSQYFVFKSKSKAQKFRKEMKTGLGVIEKAELID